MAPADNPLLRADRLPSALEQRDEFVKRSVRHETSIFLDYDGTLTPIVSRPDLAHLDETVRSILRDLTARHSVVIISGRDVNDVRSLVRLDEIIYVGSHGMDIQGPKGLRWEHEEAKTHIPDLDAAELALTCRLMGVPGALLERKRFGLSVHFRDAHPSQSNRVIEVVHSVQQAHPRLRSKSGKKVLELQPDVAWDKGRAVEWLMAHLHPKDPDALALYLGDDLTDEDGFRAVRARGLGVIVGSSRPTFARFRLNDTEEVARLLAMLANS